jgi:hypothetical protein
MARLTNSANLLGLAGVAVLLGLYALAFAPDMFSLLARL